MSASPRIQLLERAMKVLGMFGPEAHSLSLSEVAAALEMYPSSTLRLLKTLEDGGFLVRESESGRYRLGPRLLELAGNVMADFDIRTIAQPRLRALSFSSGESVSLGYYENGDVVYLDSFPGLHAFHMSVRIGARHPAHLVASGRSMLALLPGEPERLFAAGRKARKGEGFPAPEELRGELELIRERGYALDEGTFIEGLHAAASAVIGHDGEPLAAISTVAPAGRLPRERLIAAGEQVRDVAAAVSEEVARGVALTGGIA